MTVRIERLSRQSCNRRVVRLYRRKLSCCERDEYKSLIKILHLKYLKTIQKNAKIVNMVKANKINIVQKIFRNFGDPSTSFQPVVPYRRNNSIFKLTEIREITSDGYSNFPRNMQIPLVISCN